MRQESLYLDEGDGYTQEAPPMPYPSRAPPPQPPALAKYHIYNDPLEFADMDQIAISVSLLISLSALNPRCKCNIDEPNRAYNLGILNDPSYPPPYFHIFPPFIRYACTTSPSVIDLRSFFSLAIFMIEDRSG